MNLNSMLLIFGLVPTIVFALHAEQPGLVHFTEASPGQVLEIYRALSDLDLVTSSHVKEVRTGITVQPQETAGKAETLKVIEMALLKQAGIVLTKLDDKSVSVTYNDALPVKGQKLMKGSARADGPESKPISPPFPPPIPPKQK